MAFHSFSINVYVYQLRVSAEFMCFVGCETIMTLCGRCELPSYMYEAATILLVACVYMGQPRC